MKPSDIRSLVSLSAPTLHPDGTRAVVATRRADLIADRYVGQLWSVALDGALPTRITRGTLDTSPAFSPDGQRLAFLRVIDDTPQVVVSAAGGGEPITATDAPLGVTSFEWSPDSTRIAFIARVPEHGRYGTVDNLAAAAEPPRRITTLRYRSNGLGFTTDRRAHVFVVEAPDPAAEPSYAAAPDPTDTDAPKHTAPIVPAATRVTAVDADHSALAFAHDGSAIYAVSARHESRDTDLATSVIAIPLDGTEPTTVVEAPTGPDARTTPAPSTPALSVTSLAVGSRGELYLLAVDLGASARDFVGRSTSLYVVDEPSTPGATPQRLTDSSLDLGESGSFITPTDSGVLVQNRHDGRLDLVEVTRDGVVRVVISGDREVTGHAARSGVIVATATSVARPGTLVAVTNGAESTLFTPSDLSSVETVVPRELTISARDGHAVHGWVVEPRGDGPHPAILLIHGGPFAAYTVSLFDEAQVYAAAGYAVVMCNPRGAAGYGEDHARAIRHRMGTVDLGDVLDFLDGALGQTPSVDSERVGIMGGSYGGYLTAWTIAHDHRFAAAIVERGYLDPHTFVGTSDIGSFFTDEYAGTDAAALAAQSPQAVVGAVRTPTLVIHSEDDLRCPLEQGERYYSALKRGGVEAELLVFPGENHELTRSGRPRHRVQRFDAVLEWWARHLPTVAS